MELGSLIASSFGHENEPFRSCPYLHPRRGGNEANQPDKRAKRGSSFPHFLPRSAPSRGQARQSAEEDGAVVCVAEIQRLAGAGALPERYDVEPAWRQAFRSRMNLGRLCVSCKSSRSAGSSGPTARRWNGGIMWGAGL